MKQFLSGFPGAGTKCEFLSKNNSNLQDKNRRNLGRGFEWMGGSTRRRGVVRGGSSMNDFFLAFDPGKMPPSRGHQDIEMFIYIAQVPAV